MSEEKPLHLEEEPLHVVNGKETIFSQVKYFIPLYQRAFAWDKDEIQQLIDDICDFEAKVYFLGSLIVSKREDGSYEVIDGQQRLTALFLLLHYLGYDSGNDKLVYECREKSNYTLNHLKQLCGKSNGAQFDPDKIEDALKRGLEDIDKKFRKDSIDPVQFKERLEKVRLFRIEVPPHTDLNRYFEIMNVRGEQLEQHDIVKAMLMKPFGDDYAKRNAFAKIWDACRNMSGYVQMHFLSKTNDREVLFGDDWTGLYLDDFITKLSPKDDKSAFDDDKKSGSLTALEIISNPEFEQAADGEDKEGKQVRFDGIIDFPYFLLHVLRVFMGEDTDNPNISLDDKKLVDTFETKVKESNDKEKFSVEFIQYLLKCRFLFDKYIIKREREYKADDKNGVWSLQEIQNKNGKAQPTSTKFGRDPEQSENDASKNILMLQACLRVSETSPKSMNWITVALKWLYNNDHFCGSAEFESIIEEYIRKKVYNDYLANKNFSLGVYTPHLIFNYLDYLLWKNRDSEKYKGLRFDDFTFEFRNSVEHWYPQHPSSNSFDPWDKRDRFGNLCLVSREVNSKFSNANPVAKKGYKGIIEKGSLKLRVMSDWTENDDKWKETVCAEHEEEMLNLLRSACGMPTIP